MDLSIPNPVADATQQAGGNPSAASRWKSTRRSLAPAPLACSRSSNWVCSKSRRT